MCEEINENVCISIRVLMWIYEINQWRGTWSMQPHVFTKSNDKGMYIYFCEWKCVYMCERVCVCVCNDKSVSVDMRNNPKLRVWNV